MSKNIIAQKIELIQDEDIREVLRYIILELDRIKDLPPARPELESLAAIVNKITRSI